MKIIILIYMFQSRRQAVEWVMPMGMHIVQPYVASLSGDEILHKINKKKMDPENIVTTWVFR